MSQRSDRRFSREDLRWPTDTRVPSCSSGKRRSKPRRDATSHLSRGYTQRREKQQGLARMRGKGNLLASWCGHSGEQCGGLLKKLNVPLPRDPAIPVLRIGRKQKHEFEKNTRAPSSVAVFTRAKSWRPSKCPSLDGWIKKMRYIYIYTQGNRTQP